MRRVHAVVLIAVRQIFTMGDAGYFLGIVALINSLRLTGNHEPVTVLDLGMTPAAAVPARTALRLHRACRGRGDEALGTRTLSQRRRTNRDDRHHRLGHHHHVIAGRAL